jgi:hypothetical protein
VNRFRATVDIDFGALAGQDLECGALANVGTILRPWAAGPARNYLVDTNHQIDLLGKWKLRKCGPDRGLARDLFSCAQAGQTRLASGDHAGFFFA